MSQLIGSTMILYFPCSCCEEGNSRWNRSYNWEVKANF